MADHGVPCTGLDASYCMNGGNCIRIPSMSTLTCVCKEHFIGSRCEQFQLLSVSDTSKQNGLIAAVIIFIILIVVVLAIIIYIICKKKPTRPITNKNVL